MPQMASWFAAIQGSELARLAPLGQRQPRKMRTTRDAPQCLARRLPWQARAWISWVPGGRPASDSSKETVPVLTLGRFLRVSTICPFRSRSMS